MLNVTTTIDRDQRDGLYELVRNHLGAIGDVWIALEENEDFATAERLASSSVKTSACLPTSAGDRVRSARHSS